MKTLSGSRPAALSAKSIQTGLKYRRREMACSAAKLNAMGTALRILGEAETESVSGTSVRKEGGVEHFSGTIKNGSVVEKDFDASSNTCNVVFEIKEKNLKNKASTGNR